MLAKKCDRCGGFYEHYRGTSDKAEGDANSIILTDKNAAANRYQERQEYDLCPECMNRLIQFLKKEPFESRLVAGGNRTLIDGNGIVLCKKE